MLLIDPGVLEGCNWLTDCSKCTSGEGRFCGKTRGAEYKMPTVPEFELMQAWRLILMGTSAEKSCLEEDHRTQANEQCLMGKELGGTSSRSPDWQSVITKYCSHIQQQAGTCRAAQF